MRRREEERKKWPNWTRGPVYREMRDRCTRMAGHTREAVRPDKPTCERRWINISDRSVKRLQIFTRHRCSSQANATPARRRPDTSQSFAMKAVLLVGGFSTQMRPITMSLPLPLIEFCNVSLLEHQLRALKDAGVSEVLICVHERVVPTTFDEYVKRCEVELGLKIGCAKEETALGTAGPLKAAEAMITSESDPDTPFIVVNSDELCT